MPKLSLGALRLTRHFSLYFSHLLLAIAPDSIAILQCSGWHRPSRRQRLLAQWRASAEQLPSAEQLAQQLQAMLNNLSAETPLPRACHIVLSDQWARYFLVTPAQNSQRLADCEAAAQMRFQALYGDSPQAWSLQAQWDAKQAFLACALPRSLLKPLLDAVLAQDLRLMSVIPYFIASWNHWSKRLADNAWWLVFQADSVQVAVFANGKLQALQQQRLSNRFWQTPDSLTNMVQRESLRLAIPPAQRLQLCGQVPIDWKNQLCQGFECELLSALPNQAQHKWQRLCR